MLIDIHREKQHSIVNGTPERLDGEKHVKFDVFDITGNGQMDCSADYPNSKYTTETPKGNFLLATLTLQLIVTVGLGYGYAMGDTPAGVHLTDFVAPKRKLVLTQWMHRAELCKKPAFTIVPDRLKSARDTHGKLTWGGTYTVHVT